MLADRNMVTNLPFKIKARLDAQKTYVAPVTRKPIAVTTSTTAALFKPEPVLEEATYQQILKIMDGMVHVMEHSPSSFATMAKKPSVNISSFSSMVNSKAPQRARPSTSPVRPIS